MIEEVLPQIYRLVLPLPRNPLRAINSYVVKGAERNLIIDTGMNREECREALQSGLQELHVDLHNTDIFITHMHADHSGQISVLATPSSRVYASEFDAKIINTWLTERLWEKQSTHLSRNGFPSNELEQAFSSHPALQYANREPVIFSIIKDGDNIKIGEYSFTCIFTPGHSPGHMCLHERQKKFLFSGDHILGDITPNIAILTSEIEGLNPLKSYLSSLDKTDELDVDLVLPGHRSALRNLRERIMQLKKHHEVRANEILTILRQGPQDAYHVAAQMNWDMSYKSWSQFPLPQKWFATGEALSHLVYLKGEGKVKVEPQEKLLLFSLS